MKLTFFLSALLFAITAAAAALGWSSASSIAEGKAENVPIAEEKLPAKSKSEPSVYSAPPRFVYDEPLPSSVVSQKSEPPQVTSSVQPSSSSEPASQAPSRQEEPSAVVEAVRPTPTEREIDAAAAEHQRELDELIMRMTSSLDRLIAGALEDYRLSGGSNADLAALIARYLPELNALEAGTDEEAEVIFQNLTAALEEIGADASRTAKARIDYEAAKAAQLNYYKELCAAYGA